MRRVDAIVKTNSGFDVIQTGGGGGGGIGVSQVEHLASRIASKYLEPAEEWLPAELDYYLQGKIVEKDKYRGYAKMQVYVTFKGQPPPPHSFVFLVAPPETQPHIQFIPSNVAEFGIDAANGNAGLQQYIYTFMMYGNIDPVLVEKVQVKIRNSTNVGMQVIYANWLIHKWYDKLPTPLELVSTVPANNTQNFAGNEVVFEFDQDIMIAN